MAERDRIVSVIGGRALQYADKKKPSDIIPFKGNLPLLESFEMEGYRKAVETTMWIEDLSEKYQMVSIIGNRIALMVEGFKEFLRKYNLDEESFKKLSNSAKSDKLIAWMNESCIDFSQLKIK